MLSGLSGFEMDAAPAYLPDSGVWMLQVKLSIGNPSELVPEKTSWCVLVDATYPLGDIKVYPAKEGGIKVTFPHQERNMPGEEGSPWRTGKLCLDSPIGHLGLYGQSPDPLGDPELRLRWHLERAFAWISTASDNDLVRDGDPFELPKYPPSGSPLRIVHDENPDSYKDWKQCNQEIGKVVLDAVSQLKETFLAVCFETLDGRLIHSSPRYSVELHGPENQSRQVGIWWRWNEPIVLEPWQVPATWGELRRIGRNRKIDVDRFLRLIANHIRGKDVSTLLLGYPIPLKQGETPSEMHWRAIQLPQFKQGGRPPKGFRANGTGFWQRDKTIFFGNDRPIEFLKTGNWHPDRLQARGRMNPALRNMHIAIIGAGALGSAIAEFLVRGGAQHMMIVDTDILQAENLVRHNLTLHEVDRNKAEALRDRLTAVSPYVEVKSVPDSIPATKSQIESLLEDYNLVVDCTGADEVVASLALGWWSIPKLFISASVGFMAKRLFAFIADGCTFPAMEFQERIRPWLRDEVQAWQDHGETLEGCGCWSPLFPARYDDILLAAATATKLIDGLTSRRPTSNRLVIFEQTYNEDGSFEGFRSLSPTEKSI